MPITGGSGEQHLPAPTQREDGSGRVGAGGHGGGACVHFLHVAPLVLDVGAYVEIGTGAGTVVERSWTCCGTVVERLWNGCGTVVDQLWNGCGMIVERLPERLMERLPERLWNGCGMVVERLWNGCWNTCWKGCWNGCRTVMVDWHYPTLMSMVVRSKKMCSLSLRVASHLPLPYFSTPRRIAASSSL